MKSIALLALAWVLIPVEAFAGTLMNYTIKNCQVSASDGNFVTCKCDDGKVALGGGCWIKSATPPANVPAGSPPPPPAAISASQVWQDGYYCAPNAWPSEISITVTCADSKETSLDTATVSSTAATSSQ